MNEVQSQQDKTTDVSEWPEPGSARFEMLAGPQNPRLPLRRDIRMC